MMENFFHNIPVLIYSPSGDCAMIHYGKVYFMIRKAIIDVVHMLHVCTTVYIYILFPLIPSSRKIRCNLRFVPFQHSIFS